MLALARIPAEMSETFADVSHGLATDPCYAVHTAAFMQAVIDASRQTIAGCWIDDDNERLTQIIEGLARRSGQSPDPMINVRLSEECLDAIEWLFATDYFIGSARWIADVMDVDLDAIRHAVKYDPKSLYDRLKKARKGAKKLRRVA